MAVQLCIGRARRFVQTAHSCRINKECPLAAGSGVWANMLQHWPLDAHIERAHCAISSSVITSMAAAASHRTRQGVLYRLDTTSLTLLRDSPSAQLVIGHNTRFIYVLQFGLAFVEL